MAVNSLASLGGLADTGSAEAKKANGSLGKDDFVKLLLAQLGNQNPLNPQDGTQFVTQMAQFAQVELLQNSASRLDQLLLAQASANQTQSAGLIGRDVRYRNDTVDLSADGKASLGGNLTGPAKNVTWTIVDENGKTVRTIRQTDVAAGATTVSWDGRDDTGMRVPAGTYHFKLGADDGQGHVVDSTTEAIGHVSGVSFEQGFAELLVGGRKIALSSVLSLFEASPKTTN
jgi:flagellar basal-body rod modification protein FlgD